MSIVGNEVARVKKSGLPTLQSVWQHLKNPRTYLIPAAILAGGAGISYAAAQSGMAEPGTMMHSVSNIFKVETLQEGVARGAVGMGIGTFLTATIAALTCKCPGEHAHAPSSTPGNAKPATPGTGISPQLRQQAPSQPRSGLPLMIPGTTTPPTKGAAHGH